MNAVLTIAGSDCSGGAGIQADIKTMMAHGTYAMSVVTALTAQNTTGVFEIMPVPPEFVGAQMDAIFRDIPPQAVKIGMISGEAMIPVICEKLQNYQAQHIIVDPVMCATSGDGLMDKEAFAAAKKMLYPLAELLTPNIPEAEILSGIKIKDKESMQKAAKAIYAAFGCPVLCKGGHWTDAADDLLYDGSYFSWMYGKHVHNPNTHGTGCTLSSAIACNFAAGMPMQDAVRRAKEYVTGAILSGLVMGHGNGPLNHGYLFQGDQTGS